jgi:hypothetical protein
MHLFPFLFPLICKLLFNSDEPLLTARESKETKIGFGFRTSLCTSIQLRWTIDMIKVMYGVNNMCFFFAILIIH